VKVNARVRWESILVLGVSLIALGLIYIWTHQPPAPPPAPKVYVADPTPPVKITPVDWDKCLDGTATPNLADKTYSVLILNKCPVAMNDFSVSFKFYDSTDARVGWDAMSVSSLQPSEKVKWKADLPVKGYPLTVDTVRIQIFSYSKGTAE
jgi:hypothetical protein